MGAITFLPIQEGWEVFPAADAPWLRDCAHLPGISKLRWAWRATLGENECTGATIGTKVQAMAQARAARQRMRQVAYDWRQFRIAPPDPDPLLN